ncbi:hypothetical protein IF1G_07627 [Cordyceps javanica]|uniref:Uncharacterized protein n=1 Tax=Cordyceps javanica TaxID=43265 RepID=A0A545UWQ1_9HYPO|nr:hypothetical protein IF1G_07627 [Cordyceps javanica]
MDTAVQCWSVDIRSSAVRVLSMQLRPVGHPSMVIQPHDDITNGNLVTAGTDPCDNMASAYAEPCTSYPRGSLHQISRAWRNIIRHLSRPVVEHRRLTRSPVDCFRLYGPLRIEQFPNRRAVLSPASQRKKLPYHKYTADWRLLQAFDTFAQRAAVNVRTRTSNVLRKDGCTNIIEDK